MFTRGSSDDFISFECSVNSFAAQVTLRFSEVSFTQFVCLSGRELVPICDEPISYTSSDLPRLVRSADSGLLSESSLLFKLGSGAEPESLALSCSLFAGLGFGPVDMIGFEAFLGSLGLFVGEPSEMACICLAVPQGSSPTDKSLAMKSPKDARRGSEKS